MRFIPFGQDRDQVSEVILGLMGLGDLSLQQAALLVETALDAGINFLDNADIYGGGQAETCLGEVFAAHPGLREKVFLQSKCGIRREEGMTYFDFSRDYILSAVEESLQRLRTDHLDCLLLHRPDALMEPEEIAEAFTLLHRQGKVRSFGVSNQNPAMMAWLKSVLPYPIAANQLQLSCAFTPMVDAGFNVNMQNGAGIMRDGGLLQYLRQEDIPLQAWSPLRYGYFEGILLGSEKYPELNRVLKHMAEAHGVTPTAVALNWILRLPGRTQAVIGTTRPERVMESARACDFTLTRREWYEIYLAAGNTLP